MKADTNMMEEAWMQLLSLQQHLQEVESRIRDVQSKLSACQVGGSVTTAAVVTNLALQGRAIANRCDSVQQLAGVLGQIIGEYEHCETQAKMQRILPAGYVGQVIQPVTLISPAEESSVIQNYIMPLMAEGA